MSDPAAPWWAEVQHLRPREDDAPAARTPAPATPSRRFPRRDAAQSAAPEQVDAAIATLEHEVADPWADDPDLAWTRRSDRAPWDDEPAGRGITSEWAAAGERGAAAEWDAVEAPPARTPVWDDSLEEAFARTPSWSDDDAWLLPKGADRIENGRRTIEIRGQVDRIHGFTPPAETNAATRTGRRPNRTAAQRFERRPDRVALWAFLLGVLLILVAMFSKPGEADAATAATAATQAQGAAHVLVVDTGTAGRVAPV